MLPLLGQLVAYHFPFLPLEHEAALRTAYENILTESNTLKRWRALKRDENYVRIFCLTTDFS